MVQPEAKYKLFRKIFVRKVKNKGGVEQTETLETCSEDEIERAKVRKIQLAIKAQQNMLKQLKKLEETSKARYDQVVTNAIFGCFFTLTAFALANLIHAVFFFECFPSDPLDVFRSVDCDADGCTVRSYFNLEPPWIPGILFWLVSGILSLNLCIRRFFSVNTTRVLIHGFSAFLFSVTWIVKRERHYALARVPL